MTRSHARLLLVFFKVSTTDFNRFLIMFLRNKRGIQRKLLRNKHRRPRCRSTTSTGCRWRKIRWSGQFVKPLSQPAPASCVVSFTGCQFDSGFPTRSLSSPTRHVPPANRLTSLTSCKTTDQPEHYDHRTNCYCLYRGWR